MYLCLVYVLAGLFFAACAADWFNLEVPLTHGLGDDI